MIERLRRPRPQGLLRSASTLALCASLALAPLQPALAAAVVWNSTDGFWDLAANWNPGLPGVADDVTISVSGATVRTITFRTGTVTINSLASDEDLLITGGDLIVNNSYTNTQATRLQGGTLRLNGISTLATFNQSGGTLLGTGVVTVSGAATLSGATMRGAGQTIVLGSTTLGTGQVALDEGRLLEFRGGVTTSGTSFNINTDVNSPINGGIVRNAAGSVFVDSTSSSGTIASTWGGGSFENAGTYQKTGAGTTTVSTAFTNSGALDIQNGIFALNATSTQNGTIALASGAVLRFQGGTHVLNGTTVTGSPGGIVRVAGGDVTFNGTTGLPIADLTGGTLTLNGPTSITTLNQSSATLAGTGVVTVSGAASLTFATMRGVGQTIVVGSTTLGTGQVALDEGRLLEFRGGVTTSGTSFNINTDVNSPINGGIVRNAAGSVFVDSASSSGTIASTWGGGSFENAGTFQKTGAGTTTVNTAFTNSGALDIQNGIFALNQNSTIGGTINLAGGAVLVFNAGSHMINGPTFTGDAGGIVRVSGGTVTFTAATSVPTLQLLGGTLTGPGTVTASSATLSGATMRGAGQTIVVGSTTLGTGQVALDEGRLLEFRGGVTTSGASFNINTDVNSPINGGIVRNAAGSVFVDSASSSGTIASTWGGGSFENAGTFQKTGAGTTTVSTAFTNSGALDIQNGIFALNATSTQNGTIALASGAVLRFGGGTHVLNGTTVTGSPGGIVRVAGGDVTFNGTTGLPIADLTGGTLTLNGTTSIATLSQNNATLAGTGVVTISGTASLSGATMRGAGQTIVLGSTTLGTGQVALDEGRLLEFRGGVTTSGTSFNINTDVNSPINGGIVRNAAGSVFVDSTSSSGTIASTWGGGGFENAGTYQKTGAGTTTVSTAFTNSGALDIQNGIFSLTATSTQNGTIALASGAVLRFSGGTHVLNGTTVTGSPGGIVRVAAGDVTFNGTTVLPIADLIGGTLTLNGPTIIASLNQSSASLAGTGVVTVSGAASLTGATMRGAGQTIILGSTTIATGQVGIDEGRLLEFRGGVTTSGTSFNINTDVNSPINGGIVRNAAGSVFVDSASSSGTIASTWGGGSFENAGTFQKTGAGTTTVNTAFTNSGALDIQNGIFSLNATSTQAGTIALASGAVLRFGGGTHVLNGTTVTGSPGGIVRVAAGDVTFNGTTVLPIADLIGGTLTLNGPTSIASLNQSSASLFGTGVVTVSGAASLTGATMRGAGQTIILGSTTIATGQVGVDEGRLLEFRGGVTTSGTSFNINTDLNSPINGGIVRNAAGSVFVDSTSSSGTIGSNWGGGSFENAGTFQKTGAGTTTVNTAFTNSGTLDIQNGIFSLNATSTQAGTIALASGAVLRFQGGTHVLNGTTVTGSPGGIVRVAAGDVTFNGTTGLPIADLIGGTLTLNGPTSITTLNQSGATLFGTGVVTVSGVAMLTNATMRGSGQTIVLGATTLGTGQVSVDEGRLLEFRGGVTTSGTSYNINSDVFGPANGGIVRNAAGSVFVDSTSSSGAIGSNAGGGSFENAGTFQKTGAGTTTVSTAFTNSGTLDIQNSIFALNQNSTIGGTVNMASGAVLVFNAGSHTINGPTFTGDAGGIVRVSGGTVTFTAAASVPTLQVLGGTLTGPGTVTAASALLNNALMRGAGEVIILGATTLGTGQVSVDEGRLLEFRGGVTTSGTSYNINTDIFGPANGGIVRNAAGSVFIDSTSSSGGIGSNAGGGSFQNAGTYQKTGAGTTTVSTAFTNSGIVQIEAGTFRMTGPVAGASGTTLTGGTWRVGGGAAPATLSFFSGSGITSLVTNAADLTLTGANSAIVSGGSNTPIEATLATNSTNGALRILGGRNYTVTANAGNFSNAGTMQLGGGTLAATSLANSGAVTGFGAVTVAIANNGLVEAMGGTLATRAITGTGTIRIANAAALDVSAAATDLTAGTLVHNGTGLALGTRNVTVSGDYQNAAFGTGDAFDARANVSGTGVINAASATQVLSGVGLSSGGTAAPTLDLGNRRVGEVNSVVITIANGGNQTMLRGAVRGAGAPGVSITGGDSFVADPSSATNFIVDSAGGAPGSLAGQTIVVANNFDNVADQVIALQGAVFRIAAAGIAPSPVNLGNVRRGTLANGLVTITNTAINDGFSEGLAVTAATPSGAATAGAAPAGVIAAGGSAGVVVGIDTSLAGNRSGTVDFALATDGTGTSGLAAMAIASQVVTVNAGVFAVANPVLPATLAFGNRRVGDVASLGVVITNAAIAGVPTGFQEGLDAGISATSAGYGANGSVTNLAAGAADASSIQITLDTATAGARAGTASVALATNGTGTSGLPTEVLSGGSIALSGNVFRLASGSVASPAGIIRVRIGDAASRQIVIANNAVADGFSEGLGVNAISSGTGVGFSPAAGLIAAGDNRIVTASVDTATAGAKTGTLNLGFTSDGTGTSGLAAVAIGSDAVTVDAEVFALANPISIADLGFGNVQQGTVQTRTISVENRLLAGVTAAFQEGLNAGFQSLASGFSGAGAITNLGAGSTDATTLVVTLDTSSAGSRSGTVTISFASNGATTSGLGLFDLPSQDFAASATVQGTVFRLAEASVAPTFVDFGNRRVGDAAPAAVTVAITNTAVNDGFSERLDASVGSTAGRATGSGVVSLLAPQSASGIDVGIDTSAAGANGSVTIALASNGQGTSGFGTTALASQVVTLGGGVYRTAEAEVGGAATITARVGDVATTTVTIANIAVADGFSESLGVVGNAAGGVGFGNVNGLVAAGAVRNVTATVDTATAGAKSGTLSLAFTSDGAGTSGLAAIGAGNGSVTVDADVYAAAVATPGTTTIDFGVVRVGDTASRMTTLANTANGALTDTLIASVGTAPAGFSASVSPGEIAAGDTSPIVVSLSTLVAGSFGGDLNLDLVSRNPVLADLALSGQSIALVGTVNSHANAGFLQNGSALAFDSVLGGYVFDFGIRQVGSALTLADFGLGNLVTGPADVLSGIVDDPFADIFSIAGPFGTGALVAGASSSPFAIFVDTSAVGRFTGELRFTGVGTNSSDLIGEFRSARLILTGEISAVPEPSSWVMLIVGFGAIGGSLRRRRIRAAEGCVK